MKTLYTLTLAVLSACAAGAYACKDASDHDKQQAEAHFHTTDKAKHFHSSSDDQISHSHKTDKTKHLAYQKPGAAIRLAQPEFIQLDPNTQSTVEISFSTPNSGTLFLSPKTKQGLSSDAPEEWEFDLSEGQPKVSVQLTTENSGQYHVMFHARIEDGEHSSTRVFGVPVYVGEAQEVGQNKTYPTIITMEAQETVR